MSNMLIGGKSEMIKGNRKDANIKSKTCVATMKSVRSLLYVVTVGFLLSSISHPLLANPEGGNVVSGSATITHEPSYTEINQSTSKAAIDWQSFSIDKGEHTQFKQPNSDSLTLNRVIGKDLSRIFGRLSANGKIVLINQAGIVFGGGSKIDVGGLIATTADIRNEDFMAGKLHFRQGAFPEGGNVVIINDGDITVQDGGLVALVAPGVQNNGVIQARLGRVVLGSGNEFTVDLYGDQLINFVVDDGVPNTPIEGVSHTGEIYADGGSVVLSAASAGEVVDNIINMTGIIEANTVIEMEGEIILAGGNYGVVHVDGQLVAIGNDPGETGGDIQVLGEYVGIFDGAGLDVSGLAGGGRILIGGDYQGKGEIPTATASYVAEDVEIKADALTSGDGGEVIVWSDEATRFEGYITARGGAEGGDGGFVETSGKEWLEVTKGRVDASAPEGEAGEWLLDPFNVSIGAAQNGGSFDMNDPDVWTPSGSGSTVSATNIETSLIAGTSVTIRTSGLGVELGNISVDTDITTGGTPTPTLKLEADNDIDINDPISGNFELVLDAVGDVNLIDTVGAGTPLAHLRLSHFQY